MWRILAPYLINIKKLSYGDTFNVIKDWLNKCDSISKLDFNVDQRIKDNLKAVMKVGYFPISLNDLKKQNRELYNHVTNA